MCVLTIDIGALMGQRGSRVIASGVCAGAAQFGAISYVIGHLTDT